MTVDKFSIEVDAINDRSVFTNGDLMTGRIVAVTSGQTKVQAICFTAKGKASVHWVEHRGKDNIVHYHDKKKYYRVEHSMLAGPQELGPGRHVFPFTFQIPDRSMPSSFKSRTGSVVHSLQAKLSRTMRIPNKDKTNFTFISKPDLSQPGLMEPQYGSKDQDVVFFASGNVSMNVFTEKMGYKQGEALSVTVEVTNSSSRAVKPRLVLYEKRSFLGHSRLGRGRKVETSDVMKDKDPHMEPSTRRTISKTLLLPQDLHPSILNCSMIKLEYRLKVVLDVALTKDPVIKLPIVILPDLQGSSSHHHPDLQGSSSHRHPDLQGSSSHRHPDLQGSSSHRHPDLQGSSSHHPDLQGSSSHHPDLQGSSSHRHPDLQGSSSHRHPDLQGSSSHRHPDLQGSSSHHPDLQGSSSHHPDLQGSSSHHPDLQGSSSHRHPDLQGSSSPLADPETQSPCSEEHRF